jgi:hypothetical protein
LDRFGVAIFRAAVGMPGVDQPVKRQGSHAGGILGADCQRGRITRSRSICSAGIPAE